MPRARIGADRLWTCEICAGSVHCGVIVSDKKIGSTILTCKPCYNSLICISVPNVKL